MFPGLPIKIFSIYLEAGQVVPESTHHLGQTRPRVNSPGSKIVSEYDQEIPQSQTADKPCDTARKSRPTITRHQEDKLSKATNSLFPIKMIAILERTQSNVQQNIEQLQTPTMGVTINKKSTIAEPPPSNGQQPKPLGGGLKCFLLVPNPRPRFCCC